MGPVCVVRGGYSGDLLTTEIRRHREKENSMSQRLRGSKNIQRSGTGAIRLKIDISPPFI